MDSNTNLKDTTMAIYILKAGSQERSNKVSDGEYSNRMLKPELYIEHFLN